MPKPNPSPDLLGEFKPGQAFTGWKRSLYDQEWFDSRPERDMANILDAPDEIEHWVRLQRGDMPILWSGADRAYNPDFLAKDTEGGYWVIEVKSNRDLPTAEVQDKRRAALEWANAATAAGDAKWRYVLVAERDLASAKGSWRHLARLTAQ